MPVKSQLAHSNTLTGPPLMALFPPRVGVVRIGGRHERIAAWRHPVATVVGGSAGTHRATQVAGRSPEMPDSVAVGQASTARSFPWEAITLFGLEDSLSILTMPRSPHRAYNRAYESR